jgi:hypothetical protein
MFSGGEKGNMRVFAIAFAICLITCRASAQPKLPDWAIGLDAGDWSLTTWDENTVAYSREAAPRASPEGYRRIWVRLEFRAPLAGVVGTGVPVRSMAFMAEFDCTQGRERNLSADGYADRNLKNIVTSDETLPSSWQYVTPKSNFESSEKLACAE